MCSESNIFLVMVIRSELNKRVDMSLKFEPAAPLTSSETLGKQLNCPVSRR